MDIRPDGEGALAASSLLARVVRALAWCAGALSSLLIVLVLGVVVYAIFQRYVLRTPLLWGDELIGYILVAIVMLGAAEALRRDDHIAIDFLSAKAGPRLAWLLAIWSNLGVLLFAVVLGWSTWSAITFAYNFGSYSSGYIEVATWVPQIPMLIGSVLLGLVAIVRVSEIVMRGLPK